MPAGKGTYGSKKGRPKKSKRCGFGKVYDMKTKACRKLTQAEKDRMSKAGIRGYVAGGVAGGKASKSGLGAIGAGLVSAYGNRAMAKKKISKGK